MWFTWGAQSRKNHLTEGTSTGYAIILNNSDDEIQLEYNGNVIKRVSHNNLYDDNWHTWELQHTVGSDLKIRHSMV